MKLTRLLTFAALGVAAGIYLTRTEKGRQMRGDLMDRAGEWKDKLGKLRHQTMDDLTDLAEEGRDTAARAGKRASNEFA